MKFQILWVALALAGQVSVPAALVRVNTDSVPKSIPPAPHGQKFLFVMDVSESMERMPDAGRLDLLKMIYTGLNGQMQIGDSYGLWGINEQLFYGTYPMQVWDPTNRAYLATSATNYLHTLNLEGPARLSLVTSFISNVVDKVSDLTVFIISDGRSKLVGTSLDEPINEIYEKRDREARKEGKTLITKLLYRDKKLITGQVILAGDPLQLPIRPPAPPWPPAPPPPKVVQKATNQLHTASKPTTQARPILITKETIRRDREELQARLNADFTQENTTPSASGTHVTTSSTPHALAQGETNPSLGKTPPGTLTVSAREPSVSDTSTNGASPSPITALVSPPAGGRPSWQWIALGSGCLALGAGLFAWSWARRRPRMSSITRSMHR